MTLTSIKSVVDAELNGQRRYSEFVKNVTQTTTNGLWFDLSGSAGNPRAKQWFDATPLTAAQVKQSTDGGIYHGANCSPSQKYLRFIRVACASATPLPLSLIACDYLLYYPTIEDGTTDEQVMDNTITLPRYTDGKGVQMIAVTISSRTGGQQFTVKYTNSDGVSGRVTPIVTQNAATAPGTITTCATATNLTNADPFIPLQAGDKGVRYVESVTMVGADTGFFAIVLVKPMAYTCIRGIDAPYDKDMLIFANELERIYDDAYLSLLACPPAGSLNAVAVRGGITTVWV